MKIGRKSVVDSVVLFDELVAGEKLGSIAAKVGCSYPTMRTRLTRHMQAGGFKTVEQAVANHVADKIKAKLPLAFHMAVDAVLKNGRGS